MVEKEEKIAAEKKAAEEKTALVILFITAVVIASGSILVDRLMPLSWYMMKVSMLMQSRVYLSALSIYVGILHFAKNKNDLYISMIPPFLPAKELLHKFVGFLEILGGVGVILGFIQPIKATEGLTGPSAWLLIILLWAVLPSHIYCVLSSKPRQKIGISLPASLFKLVAQFIFMEWARIHAESNS
mmetsp:Transcript_16299/g.24662  ORF Transcript_16299/g.24662 Transcript_16299/m.24662 type:complete len:186 (-) Transcript_16299:61-618(-)